MARLGVERVSRHKVLFRRSWTMSVVRGALYLGWQIVRLACCAVLILMEPLVRATLVPLAFLSFLVTLIFGFLIGDPRFPRWGMLGFSIGLLMLYWLFLGVMSLFMTLPPHDSR